MSNEYKGLCPDCGEDEVYSETLTNGLCLNCHYRRQEEEREMEREARLDYEDGYL